MKLAVTTVGLAIASVLFGGVRGWMNDMSFSDGMVGGLVFAAVLTLIIVGAVIFEWVTSRGADD